MKKVFPVVIAFIMPFMLHAGSLNFRPLTANVFEPRTGSVYQAGTEKLRLDIGASHDLKKWHKKNSVISFGGDFFTYTRLRTAGKFKFPVETSDYYFGINGALVSENGLQLRTRLAHISSHLVDGLADSITFIREPFVYSREFLEFTAACNFSGLRPYAGINFIFSSIPDDNSMIVPNLGLDYLYRINSFIDLSAGYDFKLTGINGISSGNNAAQAGIIFRTMDQYGIFFSAYYYAGKSMHGMFYKDYDEYFGIGFQLVYY
ncbi:MAG: DUF1207 domain-containing protein [Candidatus Kapaibacterium sp.]